LVFFFCGFFVVLRRFALVSVFVLAVCFFRLFWVSVVLRFCVKGECRRFGLSPFEVYAAVCFHRSAPTTQAPPG